MNRFQAQRERLVEKNNNKQETLSIRMQDNRWLPKTMRKNKRSITIYLTTTNTPQGRR